LRVFHKNKKLISITKKEKKKKKRGCWSYSTQGQAKRVVVAVAPPCQPLLLIFFF